MIRRVPLDELILIKVGFRIYKIGRWIYNLGYRCLGYQQSLRKRREARCIKE
jgi:hypothetical protein